MYNHLITFENLLHPFGTDNMVLSGSMALKEHGLNFNREIPDLDVAIYNPTAEQLKYIETIKFFSYNNETAYKNEKVFKFKKDNLVLDLLISDKSISPDSHYLFFKYRSTYYKVAPIKDVVAAKNSYTYAAKQGSYIREKDITDFMMLKNDNFNMSRPKELNDGK